MSDNRGRIRAYRFGSFELDAVTCELRRRGRVVPLERQPTDLLLLLVERPGELVSRAEIEAHLWGPNVFVDADAGIHTAIRKVRKALKDSATSPSFVATVAGRGYRFVADVDVDDLDDERRPRLRLAILPFDNLSANPARDYLADGLTEELISVAGQIDPARLAVIGRKTMMRYKGKPKALSEIGRELRATHVLESSIRERQSPPSEEGAVNRIAANAFFRITTRLIQVADERQLWSESWDAALESLVDLQCSLGTAIAEQIDLHLPAKRAEVLGRRHTSDPEAYDLYLRGRFFFNQGTRQGMLDAMTHYTRATERDPSYALAWSGIADAWASSPINSDVAPASVVPKARTAATRANEEGPDLAEAWTSTGLLAFWFDRDWPAAESAYRRAVELDAGYPFAHRMLGHLLSQMERHGEAEIAMRRAREIEPLYAMHHALSSQIAFQARDYPRARQFAEQSIAIDPNFWIGYMQLGQACERLAEHELALDALATSSRLTGGNSKPVSLRAYMLAKLGRVAEARGVLHTLEAVARERYMPPYAMALVCAGLGDRDAALAWLERARDARDVHLVFLPVDSKWDAYRGEPRFDALALPKARDAAVGLAHDAGPKSRSTHQSPLDFPDL